jgi:hypothetical protein
MAKAVEAVPALGTKAGKKKQRLGGTAPFAVKPDKNIAFAVDCMGYGKR